MPPTTKNSLQLFLIISQEVKPRKSPFAFIVSLSTPQGGLCHYDWVYIQKERGSSVLLLVPHIEALASPNQSERAMPKPTPICTLITTKQENL